ncbi:OTU domain-containing protein 3-like isoform X2 [Conger conger]|uniref:OTU domain-containing protein 3-like isoform X2 n=1 Tax=Conger conger TaxID=82655 RepID=UPI002A5A0DF9|nr:OTU domain-containing protein 3-like isoform X2 [Conger conger]
MKKSPGKLVQKSHVESKQDEHTACRTLANDWKNRPQGEEVGNEFVSLTNQLQALRLKVREVPGDGNCLFRALGDQLEGHSRGHLRLRQETVQYMQAHRQDFEPFVEDDIPFTEYLSNLSQPGTFAGNDAIVAFARSHQLRIIIHQLNTLMWEINGSDKPAARELHIAYRYGDHYDSVRPIGDNSESPTLLRIENLNQSRGQCASRQPGDWQRYRQTASPPTHSDDEDLILRRLVSQSASGQAPSSRPLRVVKGEDTDGTTVSRPTLWEASGTGARIFGTVTSAAHRDGKPADCCTAHATKVASKDRKEPLCLEKNKRPEERQRLKVQPSRASQDQDQDQNQSEAVTLSMYSGACAGVLGSLV